MIQVCKILKSNGTDGGLLLGGAGQGPDALEGELWLEFEGLMTPYRIDSYLPKGSGRAVVHITDVNCLEDAEELVGKTVWMEGEEQQDARPDFSGWKVYDRGREIGIAGGVLDIPGNPCLEVGDAIVPLHEDFVESILQDRRELHLILPEGLL